jgi:glycosyltransferase involved in cell wall biosynthesis
MLDLSVIILTYNEEVHIGRCIDNIKPIAKEIFIVDSFSNDKTLEIAKEHGAIIYQNKWENNYAMQFNWALDHLPIKTKWVLRLDADEYFTQELIEELRKRLQEIPENITGIMFRRRHIFLGKWIRRGFYPLELLRVFRYGKARCEQRLMDEHIQLLEGEVMSFRHDFVDHNLNDISWWTHKHIGYAIREAIDLLDIEYDLLYKEDYQPGNIGKQAMIKRKMKLSYAKQPLFARAFIYFLYRYIFRMGFLEGKEGFLWHFLQGWWYRTLVDIKVLEIQIACRGDRKKILKYVKDKYDISLTNEKRTIPNVLNKYNGGG